MTKTKCVLFDADGVVINSEYFSVRYEKDFGVSTEKILPFFKGEFQECLEGKTDLKVVIKKRLKERKREGTVDELLDYRFKAEDSIDNRIIKHIQTLRKKGIICCLATKQEQHRTDFLRNSMGLGEVFDKIYSSAEMGVKKPEKEFFEYINKDFGNINIDEFLLIDDSEENIESAREVGMQVFYYKGYSNEYEKLINSL